VAPGPGPCPTGTAGETINRTNQLATLSRAAATITITSGLDSDLNPHGWFATALAASQKMSGTDSRANMHPAGLACHDLSNRPRATQANAVVIPHVGQGLPVVVMNEQGRNPSCVCVPNPLGSGSSFPARTKSPSITAAATNRRHRIGQPNG
jgi:hypothetical protein